MPDGNSYDSKGFCAYLESLCNDYPIISVEDGMSENDWEGWEILTNKLDKKFNLLAMMFSSQTKRSLKQV